MEGLAQLPDDTVFFTQITMEAAEDPEFLDAMRRAHIKGALVGVEAVTPEGLKDVYKDFNESGESLVERLRRFREHGVHVLGSFIFGLPSDRADTFDATLSVAERAGHHVRAVRDADAVSGDAGFRGVGEVTRCRAAACQRHSRLAALAHSAGAPAEGLHGPPGHERRRDPPPHPGGVGPVLFARPHLEAVAEGGHLDQGPGSRFC